MATYPGADWSGVSPNKSPRTGTVRYFIVHHTASTDSVQNLRALFMRPNDRNVSPNWLIGSDGSVSEIVPPDNYRAWTSGAVDQEAVTVETQNTSGDPLWGISSQSHEAIAQLVAWAANRYGFPLDRNHVFGHREISDRTDYTGNPTACPGPSMDVDWIVQRARLISAQPEGDDVMAFPLRRNKRHLFSAGPWFIRHHDDAGVADLNMKIVSAEDKWIDLNTGQFYGQLDAFGIPRNVVDADTGHVLDPSKVRAVTGGFWSWSRAAYEKLK